MKVRLPYGTKGLTATLPDTVEAVVLRGRGCPALADPTEALRRALGQPIGLPPLRDVARGKSSAVVVVSDATRPVPNALLLPPILDALRQGGVANEGITILVATGLHRRSSGPEVRALLGGAVDSVRVVQHDARDAAAHVNLGTTRAGTPVILNRLLVESDLVVVTGYIEPHQFAGYTGGRKAILPGCAGEAAIRANHCVSMIDHPNARAGIADGNPIFEDGVEAAATVPATFTVNVTLGAEHRVTGVFAGWLSAAHRAGRAQVDATAVVETDRQFDCAITTNGGFPLDRNLYQAVKGMAAAEPVVRPGGLIVCVCACEDGFGHAMFERVVTGRTEPAEYLRRLRASGDTEEDQWQLQILARIRERADIVGASEGLGAATLNRAWLRRAASVEEALAERPGLRTVAVIPDGPATIVRVPKEMGQRT